MPNLPAKIDALSIGPGLPLVLIAGPCVIDDREVVMRIAESLKQASEKANFPLIFKASFDKANRSSLDAYRGVGLQKGLKILAEVSRQFEVPVTTDVHLPDQAKSVGEVCQLLQIPAFLARQTDLLVAAAQTGRSVNVKKGQFMAPWDMKHVVGKLVGSGCQNVMLTERGTFFGYGNLVNDMKAIPEMATFGVPVVFDATHSVQQRNATEGKTGGNRSMVQPLARAAVAMGCDAVFLETHFDPASSPSDAANMLPIDWVPGLLNQLKQIREIVTQR